MTEPERAPELAYFSQKTDDFREAVEGLLGEPNATSGGDQRHGLSARLQDATQSPNGAVLCGKPPEV
jgi:hypothetical protein